MRRSAEIQKKESTRGVGTEYMSIYEYMSI